MRLQTNYHKCRRKFSTSERDLIKNTTYSSARPCGLVGYERCWWQTFPCSANDAHSRINISNTAPYALERRGFFFAVRGVFCHIGPIIITIIIMNVLNLAASPSQRYARRAASECTQIVILHRRTGAQKKRRLRRRRRGAGRSSSCHRLRRRRRRLSSSACRQ